MQTDQLHTKIDFLPPYLKEEVDHFVDKLLKKSKEEEIKEPKKLKFGCMKGKIWMSDDFDEPLEDFKDYM